MNEFDDELEIERLCSLLAVYRCNVPRPDFARVQPIRQRRHWPLAIAAMLAIVVITTALLLPRFTTRTAVPGELIQTQASPVHVRLDSIGIVDVARNTTLKVDDHHHLSLIEGTIHAKTTSAPGDFVVDTPKARAVDLGCEYILSIAANGSGILTVAAGWVALNALGAQSLVPQGAAARIASDGRLSAAYFEDAPPAFRDAVVRYSFGDETALMTILSLARERDAFTLLNLFRFDRTPDDRLRIYDRLNALVPAPGIARDAVREWTPPVTDPWWSQVISNSGLRSIKKMRTVSPR